ncbi:MAG: hypothetical protein MUC50_22815 [Myxococcota bacterium]|jgi:hypothetical protein|nr:hypothetical protein [Myxococcota bacterium]
MKPSCLVRVPRVAALLLFALHPSGCDEKAADGPSLVNDDAEGEGNGEGTAPIGQESAHGSAPSTGTEMETDTTEGIETDTATDANSCCAPPLIYHPAQGECVDPTGILESCDTSECRKGQSCGLDIGLFVIGHRCHIDCSASTHYLCPTGYWCAIRRCCDISYKGCVPDSCPAPLVAHPGYSLMGVEGGCVSVERLGRRCVDTSDCGLGQSCMAWADGERTCELDCIPLRMCPNGLQCIEREGMAICEPLAKTLDCPDSDR